jgi:hypothetical protein
MKIIVDPSALSLLWPIAPPAAILLCVQCTLALGGVLPAHGPLVGLILMTLVWSGIALVWEVIALPFFIGKLRRDAASRTRLNLFAAAMALCFVALSVVAVGMLMRT